MNQTPHRISPRHPVRRTVLLGLFTGTAVGTGYLMSGIPNVELMSCVVALAGGILGRGPGLICGSLAATVYSLGNPYGVPIPILVLAQAVGMGGVGWLAGVLGVLIWRRWLAGHRRQATGIAAALGLIGTVYYDLLTNLAGMFAFGLDWRVVLAGAIPFSLLHQASNLVLFACLYPWLLLRGRSLASAPLRGSGGAVWLLATLGLSTWPASAAAVMSQASEPDFRQVAPDTTMSAVVPPDSTVRRDSPATAPPPAPPATGHHLPAGFRRPLWDPYLPSILEFLERRTAFVPVRDGGYGAPLVFLHEAVTARNPLFLRDGVPQTTGHRLADDPTIVPITGVKLSEVTYGLDGFGGTEGVVQMRSTDPRPEQAYAEARFYAGPHETKLRSIDFLTPYAPWRLRFDFEESMDAKGYDFYWPGDPRFTGVQQAGEAKSRVGRISIQRIISTEASFSLAIASTRKHKSSIPSTSVEHQEIWGDHVAVNYHDRIATGRLRTAFYWTGRDVEEDWTRKIEVAREGAVIELGGLQPGEALLRLAGSNWQLSDTGAGDWAGADSAAVQAEGQEAGTRLDIPWAVVGLQNRVAVETWWDSHGGTQWGGRLVMATPGPRSWFRLSLERGGRAPRSDELWTVDRSTVYADTLVTLHRVPNPDLTREETVRGSLRLGIRLWGIDLAVAGTARQLRKGIVWSPLDDANRGQWRNDLELDSQNVVGTLGWQGRLVGWTQVALHAVWRAHQVRSGPELPLPPRRSAGISVLWEKRFFQEDGILQIGYWYGYRSEMADPFQASGVWELPAVAMQDLLIGFRLLGADLGMELVNLSDQRVQLTTGAFSDNRQLRWRLQWKFSQ